jgi:peptidoglycan/LPS O-acetylase OafA/YrhL
MNHTTSASLSTALPSKPRYEILDGLRGVAAMIVLLYHHFDLYGMGSPVTAKINHGYLAVDFFFILSGFVIGYAYDDRWGKMNLKSFFKRRLVRLHPMIILSTFIGILFFYFGSGDMFPLISSTHIGMLLVCALMSIFMIPAPVSIDIRGWSEINAINGNAWTLYYEYFANLLYALVIRRFSKTMLAVFVAITAVLTLNLTLNLDLFGTFADRTAQAYTVIGGWTLDVPQTLIGFTRLLFPFFAGLLISRLGFRIKTGRGGFWWCSAVLALLLVMPRIGGEKHMLWNGIYESVCILLLFPLIVAAGAGGTVSGKSAKVCTFLGEISYPLYIVQYPIVYTLLGGWKTAHPEATLDQTLVINVMCYLLSVGVAYASLKLYDIPVRRWLQANWLHRK